MSRCQSEVWGICDLIVQIIVRSDIYLVLWDNGKQ